MEERFRKFVPLDKSRKDVRNMAVDIQKQVRYFHYLDVIFFNVNLGPLSVGFIPELQSWENESKPSLKSKVLSIRT